MARGKSSTRSKVTTVGAVGLLGLGLFLGSQWNGPGAGGDANGEGVLGDATSVEMPQAPEPGVDPDMELPEQTEPGMVGSDDMNSTTEDASAEPATPELVMVQVRENRYLVSIDGKQGRDATLDEIQSLVNQATGTADGVRLQIRYHESARGVDDNRLKEMLAKAKIQPTEVQTIGLE